MLKSGFRSDEIKSQSDIDIEAQKLLQTVLGWIRLRDLVVQCHGPKPMSTGEMSKTGTNFEK